MNLNVTRSELKYYISNLDAQYLSHRLRQIMEADSYGMPGKGYFVRSLYFDSFDDECLFAKQSGVMFRQKYRFRIYGFEQPVIKFEIKHRRNEQIHKETTTISPDAAIKMIQTDYSAMIAEKNPVLNKAFITFSNRLYRPKVVIDYWREAFVLKSQAVRITIDRNLAANRNDFDFLSPASHMVPFLEPGRQILEIKYNQILPDYLRQALQLNNSERQAISKYTLARRIHKTQSWEDQ